MSERLPYEEQIIRQWDDLPLPDENLAWADMKRRLDEEDDRPLLPFWLRGCAGWGLLGLFLLAVGWWIVRPEKWVTQKKKYENSSTTTAKTGTSNIESVYILSDTGVSEIKKSSSAQQDSNFKKEQLIQADTSIAVKPVENDKTNSNTEANSNRTLITAVNGKKTVKRKDDKKTEKSGEVEQATVVGIIDGQKVKTKKDSLVKITSTEKTDSITAASSTTTADKTVTVPIVKKDSANKKMAAVTEVAETKPKKDSARKNPLVFSAGIGLQQQLPLAGQQWTPYNAQGRKGTLADYIPSVYIRLTKPQQWFLQSEFRYGAPQYTKEIVYRQSIVNDTGSNPVFSKISSNTLKKTYYHQLPLTFNYYVLPNWSIGAGIQWNKFSSAVFEKENIVRNNILQQDSVLAKLVQSEDDDTATEFKKSYWQAVAETQYQWKRFSFGARYTFGLEPYIQFTLPGGVPQQVRNNSLQLFIRYQLWKQKKKIDK